MKKRQRVHWRHKRFSENTSWNKAEFDQPNPQSHFKQPVSQCCQRSSPQYSDIHSRNNSRVWNRLFEILHFSFVFNYLPLCFEYLGYVLSYDSGYSSGCQGERIYQLHIKFKRRKRLISKKTRGCFCDSTTLLHYDSLRSRVSFQQLLWILNWSTVVKLIQSDSICEISGYIVSENKSITIYSIWSVFLKNIFS